MSSRAPLDVPRLDLPEERLQDRFDELQAKLVPLWRSISHLNRDPQTIVVVPSVSLDFDLRGSEMQAYEERMLFMLFLLRQPRARIVYVTSTPVPDDTVDYYLALLPGIIPSHARGRLDLVAETDSGWDCWAIEINLRKGGTTHPFLTLQFLTNGLYDWRRNRFETPRGEAKFLVASDHVESPAFRRLEAADLFDILVCEGLQYDNSAQRGIVLHMLPCLGDCGRFGLTAVGDSAEDAEALYRRASERFEEFAKAAAEDPGLEPPPRDAPSPEGHP